MVRGQGGLGEKVGGRIASGAKEEGIRNTETNRLMSLRIVRPDINLIRLILPKSS